MPRKRRLVQPSEATIALARAGATLGDVAIRLGRSRMTVSRYLNGKAPLPPALYPALEALLGEADARNVVALIPRGSRAS